MVQMWVALGFLLIALVLYVTEWVPMEVTSLGVLSALILFFYLFPVEGPRGDNLLAPETLLSGFANPALITVMALLVVGEGLIQTGALDRISGGVAGLKVTAGFTVLIALAAVTVMSAFINDTPVVVMFIPVMQALAQRLKLSASRVMMPLSFAAILGGMTTLIGSSTNLLVSSSLIGLGLPGLSFFEFTLVALPLTLAGFAYLVLVMPHLLPDRASMKARLAGEGKQFVSQIVVPLDTPLVGEKAIAGLFRSLPDITVHMIQRGEQAVLAPYEDIEIRPGDVLIIAATRKALTDLAARHPGLLHPPSREGRDDSRAREADSAAMGRDGTNGAGKDSGNGVEASEQVLAEIMVGPSSRVIGLTLQQIGFRQRYGCIVVGIERRAHMLRGRMTNIRLEGGDVMLVQGRAEDIDQLRFDRDFVVISGSTNVLPKPHHAGIAAAIFLGMVGLAASGILPIVIAALLAATLMLVLGPLNLRQMARALDRKIYLLVANALALGLALEATGGAAFIANQLLGAAGGLPVTWVLSGYFLLVALMTNVLTNNACSVLFTPIAVGIAEGVGVDPHIFAIATLLAANCSFATPIGYQTNLLVMGPGHHRFADFARAGLPLMALLWLVFSLTAPLHWPELGEAGNWQPTQIDVGRAAF